MEHLFKHMDANFVFILNLSDYMKSVKGRNYNTNSTLRFHLYSETLVRKIHKLKHLRNAPSFF